MVTDPPALPLRLIEAVVLSERTAMATEAPTPTSEAVVLPVAVLVRLPVWVADTVTLPAALKLPVPSISLSVVVLAMVIAATGTMPTSPPPPPVAALVIVLAELEVTLTAPALEIEPSVDGVLASPIQACVVSEMMLIETEAPMPTSDPCPPPLVGTAVALSVLLLTALIVMAPPLIVVRLAPALTCASVVT